MEPQDKIIMFPLGGKWYKVVERNGQIVERYVSTDNKQTWQPHVGPPI